MHQGAVFLVAALALTILTLLWFVVVGERNSRRGDDRDTGEHDTVVVLAIASVFAYLMSWLNWS